MSFLDSRTFRIVLPFILIFTGTFFFFGSEFLNTPAVLFKYKDRAAVDPGQDLFTVFNPFRDKTSEIEADKFLNDLKNGNCERVKSNIQINCEYENDKETYALQSWKLIDREETDDQITLHFQGFRASYPENVYSNIWIALQNDTGNWTIVDYGTWY